MRKQDLLKACFALTAVAIAGCSQQGEAKRFLQPNTDQGRVAAGLFASEAHLIESGRLAGSATMSMLDGTEISVWWSRTDSQPKGSVVLLHGLGESKAMYLAVANALAKRGYDTVLPDLRTHGGSGGRYVTYGVRERGDVKYVVDRLRGRGEIRGPLYAAGVDVGGLVALRYAAAEPDVRGVFVVDPLASLENRVNSQMPLVSPQRKRQVLAEIGKQGRFDVSQASSLRAVEDISAPVLIAQGVFDLAVPASDVQAVFQAASEPKRLIRVNEVGLALHWEQWMAEQIDRLATTGLGGEDQDS
jgi:pimeloyl-ACP methyl ester carboxylesterase